MNTPAIVQKLWNYCNDLREDSMSYGDYVEELTYFLYLKMADVRTKAPYNQKSPVLEEYCWPVLVKKDGDELFDHYSHLALQRETAVQVDTNHWRAERLLQSELGHAFSGNLAGEANMDMKQAV